MVIPLPSAGVEAPYIPNNGAKVHVGIIRYGLIGTFFLTLARLFLFPIVFSYSQFIVLDLFHGIVILLAGIFLLKDDNLYGSWLYNRCLANGILGMCCSSGITGCAFQFSLICLLSASIDVLNLWSPAGKSLIQVCKVRKSVNNFVSTQSSDTTTEVKPAALLHEDATKKAEMSEAAGSSSKPAEKDADKGPVGDSNARSSENGVSKSGTKSIDAETKVDTSSIKGSIGERNASASITEGNASDATFLSARDSAASLLNDEWLTPPRTPVKHPMASSNGEASDGNNPRVIVRTEDLVEFLRSVELLRSPTRPQVSKIALHAEVQNKLDYELMRWSGIAIILFLHIMSKYLLCYSSWKLWRDVQRNTMEPSNIMSMEMPMTNIENITVDANGNVISGSGSNNTSNGNVNGINSSPDGGPRNSNQVTRNSNQGRFANNTIQNPQPFAPFQGPGFRLSQ